MAFKNELEFEKALANLLVSEKGWDEILNHPTEEGLIKNWANKLLIVNSEKDRLNNTPLTETEMDQVLNQVNELSSPAKRNEFINGITLTITRDNPKDELNCGKEVSLKIYDRKEIAAGDSYYQIALEPHFSKRDPLLKNRRGDMMLLINGMPVIHVELKQEGVDPKVGINQIRTYLREHVFTGIFSLIQIFVSMSPTEMVYFANPGPNWDGNDQYVFHWADFNNNIVGNWRDIAEQFLSIPMAHKLIGFYTIPDKGDGILKVMRPYQIHATEKIMNEISKRDWNIKSPYGGHIWHTTGSGKTMTSFKAAERAATKLDIDKVVFLMDRIELTNQSADQYKNFAQYSSEIQETDSALDLLTKLKNDAFTHRLIVTSIQKMSLLNEEHGFGKADLDKVRNKKIVFIIDEVHRSTFGSMLYDIKNSFPYAMYFGFTGTPIQEENMKKGHTTASIIGDELHRYSIADGIRDGNVLGFDVTSVGTFSDSEIREEVAVYKAGAESVEGALSDPKKRKIFDKYSDAKRVPMARDIGKYVKGSQASIEGSLRRGQFDNPEHRASVVNDIIRRWPMLSRNGKFHAIFATSSIPEAFEYFKEFQKRKEAGDHALKVTVIVDPSENFQEIPKSEEKDFYKSIEIRDMLKVYNETFDKAFTHSDFPRYKKDVTARLAHRHPYIGIEKEEFKDQRLDIVIVVDQLLTGYDSKWVNTLYLDKILKYENIIQAFSRTNRLCGSEKPFGNIRYYRMIHTMEKLIDAAIKMYSGESAYGIFVNKLYDNVKGINRKFEEITVLFNAAGILDFARLPEDEQAVKKFATDFEELDFYLESAKIQGFSFDRKTYYSEDLMDSVELELDEETYLKLLQRYKEIPKEDPTGGSGITFPVDYGIIEKNKSLIDYDYLNSNFEKYLKVFDEDTDPKLIKNLLNELHRSFASLPQVKQKYAEMILSDISSGDFKEIEGFNFIDYVNDYQSRIESGKVNDLADNLGLDGQLLSELVNSGFSPGDDINVFGKFDNLKASVDRKKARNYIEELTGKKLKPYQVNIRIDDLLRQFILTEDLNVEAYLRSREEE